MYRARYLGTLVWPHVMVYIGVGVSGSIVTKK